MAVTRDHGDRLDGAGGRRSHDPRDTAIVEVLLQTGMQLSELARLTVYDVELPRRINREPDNTGSVRIWRKGGLEITACSICRHPFGGICRSYRTV